MLVIAGASALSDFRRERLLGAVRTFLPEVSGIHAAYVHLAALTDGLDGSETERLHALLRYGPAAPARDPATASLYVMPRPGTVSPWSSKATDIVHNCGLQAVTRVERGTAWWLESAPGQILRQSATAPVAGLLHDRMTQCVLGRLDEARGLFVAAGPRPLRRIPVAAQGRRALEEADRAMGLALSPGDIDYLLDAFRHIGRDPTDVEIMMFAQANSEHCRHKIFNAEWTVDGGARPHSLFDLIRMTHAESPGRVLSAYRDNAAVVAGYPASRFHPGADGVYRRHAEDAHLVMKVETHNHPTAISPYPGAATGTGGEIRDEAATGTGARPKAGLTGFAVSNLLIPQLPQPWEERNGKPGRIASALEIMLDAPIGAASYNNEFGRPALCGYFRTYERLDGDSEVIRGYHKPIMLAGGIGMVRPPHVEKRAVPPGARLIVLGGPAMLIGLGGGAASSMAAGSSDEDLDFASVQRDNAEIQRRCQEVIDRCWAMGAENPILSIHDVGAGGLSNALPELVSGAGRGARIALRDIPSADPGLSPMEIWCNEAQERYVLAVDAARLADFARLCRRERAPFAVLGSTDDSDRLRVEDALTGETPVDMPLPVLLGRPPKMKREARHIDRRPQPFDVNGLSVADAMQRVLQLPSVADKSFLITIGDRTVSGLVVRDQMVGPWQTPVADCAVTASGYDGCAGAAMAIGERSPVAVIDAPASGRLAIAEAITNICAARILKLSDVALSANWMAACGHAGEDALLYDTVEAVSRLARVLGVPIPVGKDSLSMHTVWREDGRERRVLAPLSLNVTAFAPVADVRCVLTPQLQRRPDTRLLLIDLSGGRDRLGGSALAQVFGAVGDQAPDLDDPALLAAFFRSVQLLNETSLLLAYHDRSDGGLAAVLCEMAFAGRCGIDVALDCAPGRELAALFSEEPGAVIQVHEDDLDTARQTLIQGGLDEQHLKEIGRPNACMELAIRNGDTAVYREHVLALHRLWSKTSHALQRLRDDPDCADEEYARLADDSDPGLSVSVPFRMDQPPLAPAVAGHRRPRVAVLREQGVNGQVEMAAAFDRAGFESVDVHMTDLLSGAVSLSGFRGLAAGGGFSYGDVLGAGGGWAKTVLFNPRLLEEFRTFFEREDTFAIGVCNGCQMLAGLRDLIPGAGHWPAFVRNRSEQFEARLSMVEILESPSILFSGMAGSRLPVAVAHGEGRAQPAADVAIDTLLPVLRFVDNRGNPAERYPANPNGSPGGLTGFTSIEGRATILMPHPERVFLRRQFSWFPGDWRAEESPWMQLFHNARRWAG
jgi:phosphoribosylformylglycinamidine synthase